MSEFDTNSGVRVTDFAGERKVEQDVAQAKCDACGGPMTFDPTAQALACEYCGSKSVIRASGPVQKQQLDFSLDQQPSWANETRAFKCNNCGGETILDAGKFAKDCIFCGSPGVVEDNAIAGIRPTAVIPFGFGKDKAKDLFSQWAKKRFFAPRAFRKRHDVEEFKAFYSPSWTFDTKTLSKYFGVVGDYYYVTVGSGNNRRTERRIRWRRVGGSFNTAFEDWLVNSSKQVDEKIFKRLMPFTPKAAAPYSNEYLAGFMAEHYSLGLNDGWARARAGIDVSIRQQIIRSLSCDVVQSLNVNTAYNDKMFKYLLLPLYTITHKYKQKLYKAYINAQNAKVVGNYPKSVGKILALVLGITVVLAGATIGILAGMGLIF
jgi:DNA-directed RNA polymerase subunit RPC12/RpoP